MKSSLVASNLYCAVYLNGFSPTSIGSVKAASRDGVVSRGASLSMPSGQRYPMVVPMAIKGLDAIQAYSIFCYAETSSGEGQALPAVIKTRVTANTTCCKSIVFTNAPTSVYSNVSTYGQSSRSLFVFTYTLSSAPVGILQVTPLIYLGGVLDTSIVATPASTTFSSTSPLTGQFYLSASPATAATLKISLLLDGTNPRHYISPSTTVQLLSESSILPAPVLVTSRLTNSDMSFLITFDSLTDESNIADASWPCSTLFNFPGASKSTCTWVTAAIVKVSYPAVVAEETKSMNMARSGDFVVAEETKSVDMAKTGDTVTVRNNKIRAFCIKSVVICSANPTASGSVVMLAPSDAVAPTVIITAPPTLGLCSNLTLDATGSYGHGGRLYKSVIWTVSAFTEDVSRTVDNTAKIGEFLNSRSILSQVRQPMVIERDQLVAATYSFTLRLENLFGLSSSSTVSVEVTGNSTMPLLTIIGPKSRTIFASSPLTILSTVSLSNCATAAPMSYKWTVELDGVPVSITSSSPDPLVFSTLPYKLSVDKTYKISLKATTSKSSATASILVYVSRGDVTAAVVGGYSRSIPATEPLILDALISKDMDEPAGTASTLKYKVCIKLTHHPVLNCQFFRYLFFHLDVLLVADVKLFGYNIDLICPLFSLIFLE